ncbi:hypothetical protein BT63DRAFT_427525 [Microthyrium microscopicum]|uniref:tRNA/rRNA methyltransferase SpoU type domain-containing protein n=1 Tax=Microthyrium microscopicum TaxID=703497 RepID=A0A6A6U6A5_9PEZI|nr:hypothetical protein BT63DRAFT_427525 [Microthyrium microscopicum]
MRALPKSAEFLKHWARRVNNASPCPSEQAILQHSLQYGSQEERKLCLYILRKSNPTPAFELYCKKFETIVFGGYSNQVDDCLATVSPQCLQQPKKPGQLVDDVAWWTTLLSAALSSPHKGAVSPSIGSWIFNYNFQGVPYSEDISNLLVDAFFPWAFDYSRFYSSLVRAGSSVSCVHGHRLCTFIQRFIENAPDNTSQQNYLRAIVAALESYLKTESLGPAYIFMGIRRAQLVVPEDVCSLLGEYEAKLSQRTLSDKVLRFYVQGIIGDSRKPPAIDNTTHIDKPYLTSLFKIQDFRALEDWSEFVEVMPTIPATSKQIVDICIQVQECLSTVPDTATIPIGDVLTALWAQVARLRHPTPAMEQLEKLLLCDQVLEACDESSEAQRIVAQLLKNCQAVTKTKPRLWLSFTKNIHHAFFASSRRKAFMESLVDLICNFTTAPPKATADYLMDCALSQALQKEGSHVFQDQQAEEGFGHAYIFDLLNRWTAEYAEDVKILMPELLKPWLSPNSAKLKHIFALYTIIFLSKHIQPSQERAKTESQLLLALSTEKSPRYRFLLEWAIVALRWDNDLVNSHFDPQRPFTPSTMMEENASPAFIVSLLKIAVSTSRHPSAGLSFMQPLMEILPTLCASTKVAIRFEALFTVILLMGIARKKHIGEIASNQIYINLEAYASSLLDSRGLPESRRLESFDATTDQTLATMFEGGYLSFDTGAHHYVKAEYFLKIPKGKDLPAQYLPLGDIHEQQNTSGGTVIPKVSNLGSVDTSSTHQSKAFALSDKDLGISTEPSKSNLILVASLVDSPYNLGGLSRAAEIYGCSELHIADIKAVTDKAFKSVSVASELHVPIKETKVSDMAAMLSNLRAAGYVIVGVEQTSSSLLLGNPSTKLPEKVVIVMGAERTGISGEILLECDMFVEIKQWGVTQSLNVQTAAGTVLYEWRRQWGDG